MFLKGLVPPVGLVKIGVEFESELILGANRLRFAASAVPISLVLLAFILAFNGGNFIESIFNGA